MAIVLQYDRRDYTCTFYQSVCNVRQRILQTMDALYSTFSLDLTPVFCQPPGTHRG